jgi:Rrf2 family protein
MKLSTRGRYGARFMLDLAMHYGNGPVLLREVSERQEISIKYLEQLIPSLRAAGLVKSTRGPNGGYHLTKPSSEITLYDVIKTLEGPLAITECVEDPAFCHRSSTCATHELWAEVSGKIVEVLSSVTLEEIAERQRNSEGAHAMLYHI